MKNFRQTSIGKIPEDWEIVRLGDVCDKIYRYPTYYNIQYVSKERGIPEVRGELIKYNGELSNNLSEYRYISKETSSQFPRTVLHEGDFVLSVRGTMGKIAYISNRLENANMTANLMRISPNRNKVYPLWMKQFFLSDFFQNSLDQASSATTIKTIKAPSLKAIELALPPFPEQKKIAEILSTVDQAIEKVDEAIEKTLKLKKGLMQELLTKGIGHKEFKDTEIGRIPKDWEVKKLINIGTLQRGHDLPNQERIKGKYPVIGSNGVVGYHSVYKVRGPGVIIGRSGTLGKVYFSSDDYWPLNTSLYVIDFHGNSPIFVYYFYQYIDMSQFFAGTGVPTLNRNLLHPIKFAIANLPEQQKIAEILSTVDKKLELSRGKKEKIERVKRGLMNDLLTGRKRVRLEV